jgi:hypothetical protein
LGVKNGCEAHAYLVVCIILFISFFFLAIIIRVVFWVEHLFGCLEKANKMGQVWLLLSQGLAMNDCS